MKPQSKQEIYISQNDFVTDLKYANKLPRNSKSTIRGIQKLITGASELEIKTESKVKFMPFQNIIGS